MTDVTAVALNAFPSLSKYFGSRRYSPSYGQFPVRSGSIKTLVLISSPCEKCEGSDGEEMSATVLKVNCSLSTYARMNGLFGVRVRRDANPCCWIICSLSNHYTIRQSFGGDRGRTDHEGFEVAVPTDTVSTTRSPPFGVAKSEIRTIQLRNRCRSCIRPWHGRVDNDLQADGYLCLSRKLWAQSVANSATARNSCITFTHLIRRQNDLQLYAAEITSATPLLIFTGS